MADFLYQGIDKTGKKVEGKLDSPNEGELRMTLRGMGIRPIKISKAGVKVAFVGVVRSIPTEVIVMFTRQLQVLVSSGIPIVQGLELVADQSTHQGFKTVLNTVREKVSQGSYFWEALGAYPLVFPKLFVALIRAGEASGSLDQMLKRLSRYLEDSERIKKILKSAAMYPIIVISIGIGVLSLMLIFVIPKFEDMLTSNNQSLPGPTQFVINLSHFFVHNFLFLAAGTTAAIFFGSRYVKTKEGRAMLDRLLFHTPIFGDLIKKSGVARFSRTLQTLLSSGVNLIDAIDICRQTIDNAVLEDSVSMIRSEIEAGKTLGMVMGKIAVFPKMAVQMISVGETTGNIDKMLEKIADFYEAEVEIMVNGMTKLIEPIVLVFLGGTVGGLLIAMYLPIFKMAGGAE